MSDPSCPYWYERRTVRSYHLPEDWRFLPRLMRFKMWLTGGGNKRDSVANSSSHGLNNSSGNMEEMLFSELYQEVKGAAPSAHLSYDLRCQLEKCDRQVRRIICSKVKDGSSSLFVACKKGNVEIVEYLISICNADVEQRGLYEVPDDRSVHTVTPLWCAAVAGKFKVMEILVKYGADVNSVSDTGSTPVRSACFMTHLDIVKLLVQNRADIQRPNYNGGTCLINSVQSVELCEFLLQHGANVNAQDIQNKTALHYAIQEHRIETTKLLLRYNANPFLESRYKDDALQTACLKGAVEIFEFLIDNIPYTPERVASAFELLGSTYLDEHHDSQKSLQYWRAACGIREKFKLTKVVKEPKKQYRFIAEFTREQDLDNLAADVDAMRMQSLLICERILGMSHKDMIYRLMYRGAAYADSLQFQKCIELWNYALELRVQRDSVLFCDTCFTAEALVKLYLDMHEKNRQGVVSAEPRIVDVVATMELLLKDLPDCNKLLNVLPKFKKQLECYDKILRTITHLLYLVTKLRFCGELEDEVKRRVHMLLLEVDPRTKFTGDTLLHLSVSKSNTLKSQTLFEDVHYSIFPSYDVTKLLIECGAKVNAVNLSANTPLHTNANNGNFKQEIVDLLLASGAHIDVCNLCSKRPVDMLKAIPTCKINAMQYLTLKCLAATVISKHNLKYKNEVPQILEEFIQFH